MGNIGPFELMVIGLMGLIGLAFVVVLALNVITQTRTRRGLRESGIDPWSAGAHVIRGLSEGQAGRPLEQRLAELDDLHERGTITDDERAAARARLLGGN